VSGTLAHVPDEVVAQVAAMVRDLVGDEGTWRDEIGPHTRLDGDLFLESVELAELADALTRRYGERVDLTAFVAQLGIDEIIALTVADVAGYVAEHMAGRNGA
jgi:acyl carrier protein